MIWIIFARGEDTNQDALPYMEVFGNLVCLCKLLDLVAIIIFFLKFAEVWKRHVASLKGCGCQQELPVGVVGKVLQLYVFIF